MHIGIAIGLFIVSYLIQINSSYGAENLAALTILTNSRGYIMPKNFTDDYQY